MIRFLPSVNSIPSLSRYTPFFILFLFPYVDFDPTLSISPFCCSHLNQPFLSSDPDFPKNIPTLSAPRRFYLPYSLSLLFASLLISNIPAHFLFPIALQPLSGSKPDNLFCPLLHVSLSSLHLPLHRRSRTLLSLTFIPSLD